MDTGDWEGTYIDVGEDDEIPDKSKIRAIASAGTNRSAASAGTNRSAASAGTNRSAASAGTNRSVASAGTSSSTPEPMQELSTGPNPVSLQCTSCDKIHTTLSQM